MLLADPLKTTHQCFRVNRRDIAYLRFISEAYDGIMVLSTLDREAGVIRVTIAPGCAAEVARLIQGLAQEVMMEPVGAADQHGLLRPAVG